MLAMTKETLALLREAQAKADEKARLKRASVGKSDIYPLAEQQLSALVIKVATILDNGRFSKFEFEASCRHGLRQSFCLNGWRWQVADTTAAVVVGLALHGNRAKRPSWKEGQPEYTQDGHSPIERYACVHCQRRLEPSKHGRDKKYCSPLCCTAHRNSISREFGDKVTWAVHISRLAANKAQRAKGSERDCAYCERAFVPNRTTKSPQRFCSPSCVHSAMRLRRIACSNCGIEFQPTRDRDKYCSIACGVEAVKTPSRPCLKCGTIFRDSKSKKQFCSRSCAVESTLDARRPERSCPICKTIFRTSRARPRTFCSNRCSALSRYRSKGFREAIELPSLD